jgi:parallel beta-helix repeat protein
MFHARPAHRVRACRPRLEVLEDRTLPATFLVDHLADDLVGTGTSGSLRYCMTQAAGGDTITFGVTGTINLTGALPDLTHGISIEGPGSDELTVRRGTGGYYQIFSVDTTVSIGGLTIGAGLNSDGILNNGTLTLTNSTVSGINYYAIANYGTLTLDDSTVSYCVTGGGISNGGTLTLTNCTVSDNRETGIFNSDGGTATLTDCTVSGNNLGLYNSVDLYSGGTLTLTDCTVSGNGSGVINYDDYGSLHARNTIISDPLFGDLGSLGHNLIGNTDGGRGFDSTDLLIHKFDDAVVFAS